MPPVTVRSLSDTLDIQKIEREARAKWQTDERQRARLEETLIRFLPLGLVLMGLIFYGLSAGHNSEIISRMSPTINIFGIQFNMGSISPLGWELGLLIVAGLIVAGWRSWLTYGLLYTLLILSCLINVAGGVISVVSAGTLAMGQTLDLSHLTLTELWDKRETLPAIYQIVLFLSIPVGIVIPIIGKLTGEGLVKLALGKITLTTMSESERWSRDSERVMYAALFTAALSSGAAPKTAGNWAETITGQFYRLKAAPTRENAANVSAQGQALENAPSAPLAGFAALLGHNRDMSQRPNGVPLSHAESQPESGFITQGTESQRVPMSQRPNVSQAEVMAWLNAGNGAGLSNRAACRLYMQTVYNLDTDAGYKTFERARAAMKGVGQ